MEPPHPMRALFNLLNGLDGQPFGSYQKLLNKAYYNDCYRIRFMHLQSSPGAFPASVCRFSLKIAEFGLASWCLSSAPRKMATADYLLRALHAGVIRHARQNRGAQGSGSFQPLVLPPQVLERNLVRFNKTDVQITFRISLPGSHDNRAIGRQAVRMFANELPEIADSLIASAAQTAQLREHCNVVEDMVVLQNQLTRYGLVAFVGDGAILPRRSAVSQAPLTDNAVVCCAPQQLAVEVTLPNAGRVRGLGIRPGVNVLIGAGFHGKSTLLNALAKGVYPHIPGDGRERVVTHPEAAFICSEEGRAVNGVDISGFIGNLPGRADARRFWTNNASGSTSAAAAIVETVSAGAKFLLIDEDSSAANFLIKDQNMRRLIQDDTITPLFDRVQELYERFGVSTLIVIGGSSDYLGVAQQVIAMQNYLPVCMTDQLQHLVLPEPNKPAKPLVIIDRRRVTAENFDPSYHAQRLAKRITMRIKPLRLRENILEYGDEQIDLTKQIALVDPHQVAALGYALLLARKKVKTVSLSPSDLADAVCKLIEKEGLDILSPSASRSLFFACPRRLEVAAAINRLRSLRVEFNEGK